MTKSGLYACIAFDGGPPMPPEAAVLGLDAASSQSARGVDLLTPQCVSHVRDGDSFCLFVGRIDDVDGQICATLGLAADSPAAAIAGTALDRFGDDIAAHLPGEWSCLLWDGKARRLRLAVAMMLRDPVFYRVDRGCVMVAPSIATMRRLGRSDGALDEEVLSLSFARPPWRHGIGDRTLLSGVRRVQAGTVVTIDADGRSRAGARPMLTPFDWSGDFDAALADVERLMRDAMRRRLAGHSRIACLISGGLDSSIIAWLAATGRSNSQELTLLSSVAPSGSGTPDERDFSGAVARHLGVPIRWVTPDPDAPVYRPSSAAFGQADGPVVGPRHYLYDALNDAAIAEGATLLLDGIGGEMSVTGGLPLPTFRNRVRLLAKRLMPGKRPRGADRWPTTLFLARMAPHRLAAMSSRPDRDPAAPLPLRPASVGQSWGFAPGYEKLMRIPSEAVAGQLRADYPFRDAALLRRFAGFPAAYTYQAGLDRAFARTLLAGHLPDSIRLRPKGSGFSPDFDARLQRQAADQRARIPLLRRAGIGDWFDLDWLDSALQHMADLGPRGFSNPMEVQTTALAAEYLYWWFEPDGA